MKITKALQSTAHHEAGHAVAALTCSIPTRKLSIIPRDGSHGRFTPEPCNIGMKTLEFCKVTPRVQRTLENRALIALAGPAAERRFNPKGYRKIYGEDDYDHACTLLEWAAHSDKELKTYFRLIEIRAEILVENPLHWLQIQGVAKALLERGELSGKMVKEVIVGVVKEVIVGVHV
jgi:hypothetical protein